MEKNCGNCANYDREKEAHADICGKCVIAYVEGVEQEPSQWRALPQTNADRIRAMSDEELAVMLAKEIPHGDCWGCRLECGVCDGDKFDNGCMNGFYKWLKQPADQPKG